jgi:hypothetical protein
VLFPGPHVASTWVWLATRVSLVAFRESWLTIAGDSGITGGTENLVAGLARVVVARCRLLLAAAERRARLEGVFMFSGCRWEGTIAGEELPRYGPLSLVRGGFSGSGDGNDDDGVTLFHTPRQQSLVV